MIIFLATVLVFIGVVYIFIQQPKFGKAPSGERLERIKKSANYKEGKFQNLSYTPALTEGVSMLSVLNEFFFKKKKHRKPPTILPSQKTNLLALAPNKDVLVWFGHSSYFIQIDGKKILVDPVLSGAASPVKFTTRSFPGSDIYTTDDFPAIDYLFISHDHWDHLDYETVLKLKPKINRIICALGVGEHFERWGFDKHKIIEKDWNEEIVLEAGFVVNTAPGRHFSGRSFKRNISLWTAFVLETPTMKLFLGGDSGYDTHFKNIGNKFGPFDLAILECGQYDKSWKYIHMMPEETVQAAIDLQAKKLLPVHWDKFALANHDWDTPIKEVTAEAKNKNLPIITPMIGQEVELNNDTDFIEWWKEVK